jgi:hypothetical protein
VSDAFTARLNGPAPEREVAGDLIRRGLIVAPVLLLFGLLWGTNGVVSVAFALALVLVNFALAAASITFAARISVAFVMGSVLFGFLIRMGLILLAVLLVVDAGWFEPVPLGITLVLAHLGLLFWELPHVSASLAFPGLKPGAPTPERQLP